MHGRALDLNGDGECQKLSQLLLVDYTTLVKDAKVNLCSLVNEFGRNCDQWKLQICIRMSEMMKHMREDVGRRMEVALNGEFQKEVESFKFSFFLFFFKVLEGFKRFLFIFIIP